LFLARAIDVEADFDVAIAEHFEEFRGEPDFPVSRLEKKPTKDVYPVPACESVPDFEIGWQFGQKHSESILDVIIFLAIP
jgi:hypothetical protein